MLFSYPPNIVAEHVAVAALKCEVIEKGHSFGFDAFKETLESFEKGTLEVQIATNHLIMKEIKKFVIPDELERETMFFRMIIQSAEKNAEEDFFYPFKKRTKFEEVQKWLNGFLKRVKVKDSRYYEKEMIRDFINFRPKHIEDKWEKEMEEFDDEYGDYEDFYEEEEDMEEEEDFEGEEEFIEEEDIEEEEIIEEEEEISESEMNT